MSWFVLFSPSPLVLSYLIELIPIFFSFFFCILHCLSFDLQVLMNLQLYMVDSINYLVDFHHKKSYRASTDPGAGKFDMAVYDPLFSTETNSESGRSLKEKDGTIKEDEVVSPFVFMDVACKLILELAGGS